MTLQHLISLLQSHAHVYGGDLEVLLQIADESEQRALQGNEIAVLPDPNMPTVLLLVGAGPLVWVDA